MKAAVINKYGNADNFEIVEVEKPKPKKDEVLIKVKAASINPIDWKIRKGTLRLIFGAPHQMILGFDVAGVVEETGSKVANLKVGDAVYSRSGNSTGQTYAEYVAIKENEVTLKPKNLNFLQAAAFPLAGLTALQALRDKAKYKKGQEILIIGGSGGVGSFAVQLARNINAKVTATCSTANMGLVKYLGADRVIDYKKEEVKNSSNRFDIIFDTIGNETFFSMKHLLKPHGIYVSPHPKKEFLSELLSSIGLFGNKRSKWILLKKNVNDLQYMTQLIEEGKIIPVVDKVYQLNEISEAHKYSETGRAKGKIVIEV